MRILRLLPLVLVAAAGLAAAGAAAPAAAPTELTVTQTPAGSSLTADVDAVLSVASAAPATIALYVPPGYTAALAQPPGTALAQVAVRFLLTGGGATIGRGTLTSVDPAAYAAGTCAPGIHAAVWVATVALAGQAVSIPFFVDPVSPELSADASLVVRACFDPPAAGGMRIAALELDFPGLFHTPAQAGLYVWRAVVTPYSGDGALAPDVATEVQALVPLPHRIRARARYDARRRRVTLSGSVVAGRRGDSGSTVTVLARTRAGKLARFGSAPVSASGRFSLTKPLSRTTTFALLVGSEIFGDGECEPTIGSAPCSRETIAPSDRLLLNVKVPAAPSRRR